MPELKIETMRTDELIPYARNARTHTPEQVGQIAASIREFGFVNPVLIGGSNGIIAGHGRVMAAQKLGLATVPCIRLPHLTDIQRRAYILADNKIALNAGWDADMLALELSELQGEEFNLDLTGFNAEEIGELTVNEDAPKEDEGVKIGSCFEVIAECESEEQQAMVHNLLTEREIKCRLCTL